MVREVEKLLQPGEEVLFDSGPNAGEKKEIVALVIALIPHLLACVVIMLLAASWLPHNATIGVSILVAVLIVWDAIGYWTPLSYLRTRRIIVTNQRFLSASYWLNVRFSIDLSQVSQVIKIGEDEGRHILWIGKDGRPLCPGPVGTVASFWKQLPGPLKKNDDPVFQKNLNKFVEHLSAARLAITFLLIFALIALAILCVDPSGIGFMELFFGALVMFTITFPVGQIFGTALVTAFHRNAISRDLVFELTTINIDRSRTSIFSRLQCLILPLYGWWLDRFY